MTISIPSTRYLFRICFENSNLAGAASSFPVVAAATRSRTQSLNQLSMVRCGLETMEQYVV